MPDIAVYLDKLRSQIAAVPAVEKYAKLIEEKSGVRYEYVAAGVGVLMALLVFFGLGADFICNLVGFLYPTYASIKAIESKDATDDTQWLVYWVVYGMFTFLETFIDLILYWIPFFYPIKIAFLLWCMHPQTKGATVLYNSFIRDLFKAHQDKIDKMLNEGANTASATASASTKKDN